LKLSETDCIFGAMPLKIKSLRAIQIDQLMMIRMPVKKEILS
jgi:hypothetical protein